MPIIQTVFKRLELRKGGNSEKEKKNNALQA